jgi:hypothetical protein
MSNGSGRYGYTVSIERPYRTVSHIPLNPYPYRIRTVTPYL